MKHLIHSMALLGTVAAIFLSSCASGPDLYLTQNISETDKAEFLFSQGVKEYETLILQENDLTAVPRVRKFFEYTLEFDPLHAKAPVYLTRIDDYTDRQFNRYIERARKLYAIEKRSATEEYDMLYAIARAGEAKSSDRELAKLKRNTSEQLNAVVDRRMGPLLEHEERILAENDPRALARLVPEANRLMESIDNVDPGNKTVEKARKTVGDHIATLAEKDINEAKAHLAKHRYAEAEESLTKAEKTISGFDAPVRQEINQLKYDVYMRWGTAHYNARRYPQAIAKANQALAIQKTTEAVNLKAKSRQVASASDHDADINTILSGVDDSIARGNLLEAWDTCNANIPRMKQKANQDRLNAKKNDILAALKPVYSAGIAAYNDEDYNLARDKFSQIVAIQPSYEQAQAYLDRANSKLRALSGSN